MEPYEGTTIIDADAATIEGCGICGYKDTTSPGLQRKLAWLRERFKEGMRVKLLLSEHEGNVGSIEYVPGEFAWRVIHAPGYMVIHCLFILKRAYKGRGYGSLMIEVCEKDARDHKMHGVAVVTTKSTWMVKKEIFLRRGYELAEEAPPHYQLLAKRFTNDAPLPTFSGSWEERLALYPKGLTIIYSDQCPYVAKTVSEIPRVAKEEFGIEPAIIELTDCRSVQDSPSPYGTFSIVWNGELVADHPISATRFRNIMRKLRGRELRQKSGSNSTSGSGP